MARDYFSVVAAAKRFSTPYQRHYPHKQLQAFLLHLLDDFLTVDFPNSKPDQDNHLRSLEIRPFSCLAQLVKPI